MKKKAILTVFACFLVCLIAWTAVYFLGVFNGGEESAVGNQSQESANTQENISGEETESGIETTSEPDTEFKEGPASYLTKTYRLTDFMSALGLLYNGEFLAKSSALVTLSMINEGFPIEYIKYTDDKSAYIVYSIGTEEKPCYIYLFYKYKEYSEPYNADNLDNWWLLYHAFFVSKPLCYKDFENIKIGSTLSEVAEIDPVVSIQSPDVLINGSEEQSFYPKPLLEYRNYLYLTDGILCITYERENEDSKFAVASIGLNETFEMPVYYTEGTMPFKIASEDYCRG